MKDGSGRSTGTPKWLAAFDSDSRVREYDASIDLFSLRRRERLMVIRTLLPVLKARSSRILELGAGTGLVTEHLAAHYPGTEVIALDAAQKMIDHAQSKKFFRRNSGRIRWILADYTTPEWTEMINDPLDLVVAFDSLHHLDHRRVPVLYGEIFDMILPGGGVIVSDHMTSALPFYEDPQFILWLEEIRKGLMLSKRGGSTVSRYVDGLSRLIPESIKGLLRPDFRQAVVRHLLDEGENPLPVMAHVDAIRAAGFHQVKVEYRFAHSAIISARKD